MWIFNELCYPHFLLENHIKVGDRIKVRLPDKEHEMLVVGTAVSPEFAVLLAPGSIVPDPGGYAAMFLPSKFLQGAANLKGSFNQLLGMAQDNSTVAVKNTMQLLADKLENYGVQLQTSQQNQMSAQILHDELVNVQKSTTLLPTMFLLIAILILNVMIIRLVVQQRGIIGTLKAIGYSNISIFTHYLSYALVIGLLGGILGDGLGIVLQYLMLAAYKNYFVIPNMGLHLYTSILLTGIGLSVGSALIGSILGAYKAVRLSPAIAMRHPAPEKGAHIILEYLPIVWRKLSFQSKMTARSIFRNRFRSLVTVAAAILATALVFSALNFLDSIYEMINSSYEAVQHQDYTLTLREPLGSDIMRQIAILPGVDQIEGQLSVAAELSNGPYVKRTAITGLPKYHPLFTPVDKDGKQVEITTHGLVINQTLANILHLKLGDQVKLRPLIGRRTPTMATVNSIIKNYMGLTVYADQTWMSLLLGDTKLNSSILFKMRHNTNLVKFMRAVNRFAPVINLTSREKEKQVMIDNMEQFLVFVVLILIGFAGVIAIGSIINTAMISLSERQRDAASLRVLGFSNWQVSKIFFGESVILNGIGIFFGLFAGIYFAYYMSTAFSTEIFRMPMIIKTNRLVQTALIMLLFVGISQMLIYRMIKKLNWFAVLNERE